eukprot:361461-Chlamydomonas_euryale.AAC.1
MQHYTPCNMPFVLGSSTPGSLLGVLCSSLLCHMLCMLGSSTPSWCMVQHDAASRVAGQQHAMQPPGRAGQQHAMQHTGRAG